MFKRKLKALDYIDWDKVNGNDEQHFRKLVVWLEDQKIRHYPMEDRKNLRDIGSSEWPSTFEKYCEDVGCPSSDFPLDRLEWLVGLAVRLEFEDGAEKYRKVRAGDSKRKEMAAPSLKSTNPLDNIDFHSEEFVKGVGEVAKLLKVPAHPNHLTTLEACSKVVCARLNADALRDPSSVIVEGKPFPVMEAELGFDTGDKVLNSAAKVLRLLYIHDLRDLQTKINEAIVSVQTITANPKTDTKLGKVGF